MAGRRPGTTPGEERNLIHTGELVLGHDNAADTLPPASARGTDEREEARRGWLRNGSFLVVRRYRQFVDRFDEAVARGVSANLCDAIARLAEAARGIEIGLTWARSRPASRRRETFRFSPEVSVLSSRV